MSSLVLSASRIHSFTVTIIILYWVSTSSDHKLLKSKVSLLFLHFQCQAKCLSTKYMFHKYLSNKQKKTDHTVQCTQGYTVTK